MERPGTGVWALVLGGSSGLGLATALKLAQNGYSIFVVHRDARRDLPQIHADFGRITALGVAYKSFNIDATNPVKRGEVLDQIAQTLNGQKIKVLVHSIAKGILKPMVSNPMPVLQNHEITMTLNAMALSLYDFTKALHERGLFHGDTRIVSFTSEGNTKAWPGYAAVSVAKAALEALTRNIALEFASAGIKANCVQAGVTETKAFAMIPDSSALRTSALARNPNQRLTTPEDIANVVYLLSLEEAKWITGTVIKADGGESLR